ncbi:hypothetical protein MPTK1_4g01670 [Marchantia polymorpha subsp. ruderalis]|uniref:U-box domain-containing protein n=2 Tax=Marchantia polymorpha TaxID=3197 RepID=A0AAF6B591_MARPO|nr:hypothetical protein MARPO_0098s0033 [Marchantia polymorpha]BBN07175.1 hypothetical protein Mp_4g01670 [Marchantia polymorpha subsp. ruderalis]|eukprot:PTQ32484.1 hypothetical protein MARPO_0098s0033 [Marchantia polymorpha]
MSVRVDDTNSRLSTLRAMNRQKGFQGNSLTADIVTCGSKLEQVGDGIRTLIDYLLELQNKYRSSSRQLCAEDEVDKFVKFLDYIAEDRLPLLMENRNAMSTIDAEQLGLEPLISKLKEAANRRKTWKLPPTKRKRVLKTFQQELRKLFSLTFTRTMILREQCNDWDVHKRLADKEVEDKRRQLKDEFLDPVTGELMCDPVKGSDGFTYDRWTFIDDNLTRSHFNRTSDAPLSIACDDVNVRSRLFEKYQNSGVEERFRDRRRQFREHAIMLAKHGGPYRDSEVLKMLDHVLLWDFDDAECRRLRDARVERLRLRRRQSVTTIYPRDPWTDAASMAIPLPSRPIHRWLQLMLRRLRSAGSLLYSNLCEPISQLFGTTLPSAALDLLRSWRAIPSACLVILRDECIPTCQRFWRTLQSAGSTLFHRFCLPIHHRSYRLYQSLVSL